MGREVDLEGTSWGGDLVGKDLVKEYTSWGGNLVESGPREERTGERTS